MKSNRMNFSKWMVALFLAWIVSCIWYVGLSVVRAVLVPHIDVELLAGVLDLGLTLSAFMPPALSTTALLSMSIWGLISSEIARQLKELGLE